MAASVAVVFTTTSASFPRLSTPDIPWGLLWQSMPGIQKTGYCRASVSGNSRNLQISRKKGKNSMVSLSSKRALKLLSKPSVRTHASQLPVDRNATRKEISLDYGL